jgi:hypothetical protein
LASALTADPSLDNTAADPDTSPGHRRITPASQR